MRPEKGISEMNTEELESYLNSATDKELEAISEGRFAPPVTSQLKFKPIQLPKLPESISTSDIAFFALMSIPATGMAWCFAMLLSPVWLPITVDKPAYDYAAKQPVPTRVYYCADTDFGGRYCSLRNNQQQIEKFVIRSDR